MVSTLIPVLIVSAVYLIIFLVLRRSQRRYYAPRTYLGSLRERYMTLACYATFPPPLPSQMPVG